MNFGGGGNKKQEGNNNFPTPPEGGFQMPENFEKNNQEQKKQNERKNFDRENFGGICIDGCRRRFGSLGFAPAYGNCY